MVKARVRSTVLVRSVLLVGSLVLLPAWARADDFSFSGDSGGCSDPPITSEVFSFSVNTHGGLCLGFGNHSHTTFSSLNFTTAFPTGSSALTDPLLCDGGVFFDNCGFSVDGGPLLPSGHSPGRGSMITVEFFGGPGIPDAGSATDNFFINMNNPGVCSLSPCGPPADSNGTGDWVHGVTVTGFANVPEPATLPLLLVAFGALLGRASTLRNGRGR
jgi:hypothetical protein